MPDTRAAGDQGQRRRAGDEEGSVAAHAGHYARIATTMVGLLTLLFVSASAASAHAQSASAEASTSAKATADKSVDKSWPPFRGSRDGERFLMMTPVADDRSSPFTIVINWAGGRH